MLDLRLYNPTGNYADQTNSSEYMQLVRPEDPSASGIEVIAGKVVKYLLTGRARTPLTPDTAAFPCTIPRSPRRSSRN